MANQVRTASNLANIWLCRARPGRKCNDRSPPARLNYGWPEAFVKDRRRKIGCGRNAKWRAPAR